MGWFDCVMLKVWLVCIGSVWLVQCGSILVKILSRWVGHMFTAIVLINCVVQVAAPEGVGGNCQLHKHWNAQQDKFIVRFSDGKTQKLLKVLLCIAIEWVENSRTLLGLTPMVGPSLGWVPKPESREKLVTFWLEMLTSYPSGVILPHDCVVAKSAN